MERICTKTNRRKKAEKLNNAPMTEKQYQQELAALYDRYMFEDMTNREFEEQRQAIETYYLKTIYNKS